MTPKPKASDLIGTAEAAAILGKDITTIQRMVRRGELKRYARAVKSKGRQPILLDRRQVDELKDQVIEVEPKPNE